MKFDSHNSPDCGRQEHACISAKELQQNPEAALQSMTVTPPTLTVFGKTGAGKSSTLNALFDLNLPIDAAVSCTKQPRAILRSRTEVPGLPIDALQVVDMPGIAESTEADVIYSPFFEEWLPQTNSLLWITQANTRAYTRDQLFMAKLKPLFPPSMCLTIGLNKFDRMGVGEDQNAFDERARQPSAEQVAALPSKIADIREIFGETLGTGFLMQVEIVAFSAYYGWNLDALLNAVLRDSTKHL